MPGTSTTEVDCVKCQTTYEADVIEHIDLSEERDMIRALRTGKVNRVQCPKCRKVMYLDRSVVINFEPDNLIVVYDSNATSPRAKSQFEEEFRNVTSFDENLSEVAEDTDFRVISDLDELKQLLKEYKKTYL
jgi:hypothetical protein